MITEESFIDFRCPYCQEPVSFPRETAGFVEMCPSCTESLIVPGDGSEEGLKIPLPRPTPRLVLRRLAPGDWRDLLELMADEEFFRYQDATPLDEDGVLRWLQSDGHVKLTTPDQPFVIGIQVQEGEKLIGYASLTFTDPQRLQVSLNVALNSKFHRKGYGTEAVEGLLGFCFQEIKLHRVTAATDSRNVAACKLCEKVGFRREGEFVKNRWAQGEWTNTVYYALLAEDCEEEGQPSSQAEQSPG